MGEMSQESNITDCLILTEGTSNNVTDGLEFYYLNNGENVSITFPETNLTTGIITSVYVYEHTKVQDICIG